MNSYYQEENKKLLNEIIQLIDENKYKPKMNNKLRNHIFNKAKFIIDHDYWFTNNEICNIQNKCYELKFLTEKQKSQLSFSSIQKQEYDYCDDGANSDEDRRWMD